MKKVFLVLCTCLIACSAFASVIGIDAGVVGFYDKPLVDVPNTKEVSFENFTLGASVDAKVVFLLADATATYNFESGDFAGLLSANAALDIAMIRVEAGVGFDFKYNVKSNEFYFHGLDDPNNFLTDPVTLRAAASIDLGDIRVQAFATSCTGASINDLITDFNNVDWNEYLNKASCGVAIKFNLI